MTRRRLMFAAILLLSFIAFAPGTVTFTASQAPAAAATAKAAPPEYGPANGTLVIVGGGSTDGTTIMEKFVELGGSAPAMSTT
jgi:hypothetical protein